MSNGNRRKLYRIPEKGKIKGVCAGLAYYFDVPVRLIRVIAVLSLFFGLFGFVVVAYIVLVFVLDPAPTGYTEEDHFSVQNLLNEIDYQLKSGEIRLRQMERYITSETFSVRSRFRQL
ncbi:envelope stress response membrane protein PspC [Photorhabdus bodei]|uniref:Envelope stress response membrane protein PspC n=1 Tax=Photorhabdus bodei TaxID=2029681 RepID=A0A329XCH9_9GAMM|nr:envelope stress response membrane protein PspC [Photorhabdus bodei]NDK98060.1 envelope stress response membrane protein PspC [Photorhabdus bodei]NDL02310.1 envelope stress response membrane protein PspC [Photorhabdus bodei]NDL06384.1 envelope stress response membrane protein PspC [Photorhabdus bodei]RAX14547.1 envelope stress response membrane protein PspC [Photorhabdus bodei]